MLLGFRVSVADDGNNDVHHDEDHESVEQDIEDGGRGQIHVHHVVDRHVAYSDGAVMAQ